MVWNWKLIYFVLIFHVDKESKLIFDFIVVIFYAKTNVEFPNKPQVLMVEDYLQLITFVSRLRFSYLFVR